MINAAGELKYIGQLKRVLAAQFKRPEDEWVRFLTTRAYEGSFTQRVRDQFLTLVDKAARQFLNEQVNDRLKNALGGPDSYVSVTTGTAAPEEQVEVTSSQPDAPTADDENKIENRVPITGVEDIYHHADTLRKTVSRYLSNSVPADSLNGAHDPSEVGTGA